MPESLYFLYRTQALFIVLLGYQFYLFVAIGTDTIDETLKGIERVGSWPVQVLNIGLFMVVLGICWLYLKNTRADLTKLQQANEAERKEYVSSLKTLVADMGKIIERNNLIYERVERRLERIEQAANVRKSGGEETG